MTLIVGNRVQETTTTVSTGTVALLGPVSQFRSFSSVIGDGNSTYYTIADQSGTNWEEGIGTYTASGSTLSRTIVLSSSNNGALVNFGAGTKNVFCSHPSESTLLASPFAYPTIKPTLNLDFVNSKQIDQRINFSRSSTATYYDGKTSVMAEQNLVIYSQQIGNASWGNQNSTAVLNTTSAPDSTTTASLLYPNAGVTFARTYNINTFAYTASVPYTYSIYAKASGINYITLAVSNNGGAGICWFNLSTGAVGTNSSGGTTSITSVGSGWYRCVVTIPAIGGNGYSWIVCDADNSTVVTPNGTNGVYLWGAQLEQRSSATAYTPTTPTAVINYIPQLMTAPIGVPRLDYNPTTGKALGLLIEEARTNLLTYSSDFSNAVWTKTAIISVNNSNIAPDSTLTAQLIQETTAANSYHFMTQAVTSVTSGASYTFNAYVKYAGVQYAYIQFAFGGKTDLILVDTTTGTITSGTGAVSSIGNGWFRISVTTTAVSTTSGVVYIGLSKTSPTVTTYTGNGYSGIYIWGAQLEVGPAATSYIPTLSSIATRSADIASISGANFSSWYNPNAGTVCCSADYTSSVGYPGTMSFGAISMFFVSNKAQIGSINTYDAQFSTVVLSPNIPATIAFSYFNSNVNPNIGNLHLAVNGIYSASDDTHATYNIGSSTSMLLGKNNVGAYLNGHIKKLSYYPAALSSDNLQAITNV